MQEAGLIKYYAKCNYGVMYGGDGGDVGGCNHVVKYPERATLVVSTGLELFTALRAHGQDIPGHLAHYEASSSVDAPLLTPLPDEENDRL